MNQYDRDRAHTWSWRWMIHGTLLTVLSQTADSTFAEIGYLAMAIGAIGISIFAWRNP